MGFSHAVLCTMYKCNFSQCRVNREEKKMQRASRLKRERSRDNLHQKGDMERIFSSFFGHVLARYVRKISTNTDDDAQNEKCRSGLEIDPAHERRSQPLTLTFLTDER